MINYEKEVKKIYPEAYAYIPEYFDVYVVRDKVGGIELASAYFVDAASQSAYETLIKQNKIIK